jgi:hypothetical protein
MRTSKRQYNDYQAGMNEGGEGYNPHAATLAKSSAADAAKNEVILAERIAAKTAAAIAEWTKEVTTARRGEWNAWVRSTGQIGLALRVLVSDKIKAQGWGPDELRAAIVRHGL